jgi:RNA polymerase sigma-70 factor (ECF subfamily)
MIQTLQVTPQLTFDELFTRYERVVYRFCLAQTGNPTTAEDIAAETFRRAFTSYSRVQLEPDESRVWLLRIARNLIIDQHRAGVRLRRFLQTWRSEPSVPDVETTALHRDKLREVMQAINTLRARDKMLVGLRVAAGLSFAEIGQIMEMSEHAAGVNTRRALERVRKQVAKEGSGHA